MAALAGGAGRAGTFAAPRSSGQCLVMFAAPFGIRIGTMLFAYLGCESLIVPFFCFPLRTQSDGTLSMPSSLRATDLILAPCCWWRHRLPAERRRQHVGFGCGAAGAVGAVAGA